MKKAITAIIVIVAGITSMAEAQQSAEVWERAPLGWLSPSVHLNAAIGETSADDLTAIAAGHHDPTRKEGTVQGLELGLSMRAGEHLHGFATYNLYYGDEEEWDAKWEEAFVKLANMPGGLEARGGRMLSRFGLRNNKHLHAWNTVDMPLALGRFLGDDGLIVDGGDITWTRRFDNLTVMAVGGYGEPKSHAHDHEGEHHHEEEEHHAHAHDEGTLSDQTGTGRLIARYTPNDFFSYAIGGSFAGGDNGYNRTTKIFGVDFSFLWRENGLESGGRALEWSTEALYRDVEAFLHEEGSHEHEDVEGHHDHEGAEEHHEHNIEEGEFGAYSELIYSVNSYFDFGGRVGFVEGNSMLGISQRFRVSPVATVYLGSERKTSLRVQYNYDDLKHDEEHSVWLQLGWSWGEAEVR